jgi:hypothetical protein
LARGSARSDRPGDQPRRQVLRGTGQHPRPELALVQHQGAGGCWRRAAGHVRGDDRARPQAERGRRGSSGPGGRTLAGAPSLQLGHDQ